MLTSQFDYQLPKSLIAQKPQRPRDQSRLLILDKHTNQPEHKKFFNIIDYLNPGDVLVLNNSKVIPARLIGQTESGGKREIFLLHKDSAKIWQCLVRGKIKATQKIFLPKDIVAEVVRKNNSQSWLIKFNTSDKKIFAIGQTPTPPYIKPTSKMADYQTVYAKTPGSVAAPTAGLHFTPRLLAQLKKKGIKIKYITLHVGLGTFLPVKSKKVEDHQIHHEFATIDTKTATELNKAKKNKMRIVAVGTTTIRTLEAFSNSRGVIKTRSQWTNIFVYPGYKFKFVDALITNFHLPKSTLLMLVSAFANTRLIKKTYQLAIAKKYRFYSFGDAMLIK